MRQLDRRQRTVGMNRVDGSGVDSDIIIVPQALVGQPREVRGRVDLGQLHADDAPAALSPGFTDPARTVGHEERMTVGIGRNRKPVRRRHRPDLQRLEQRRVAGIEAHDSQPQPILTVPSATHASSCCSTASEKA